MSAVKEMQIEQEFVKIQGTKYNISRELGSALKREHKKVEELEKEKMKQVSQKIKELTLTPITVMTMEMKLTATMNVDGSIASQTINAESSIRNNLEQMLKHQSACLSMVLQKWCGLNKDVLESVYGKMEEPVTEQRNEQATQNLQIAA